MSRNINLLRIKAVARALDDLNQKIVFVGGAILSFYPDREVYEVRPTDDVDVIIEIFNYLNRSFLEDKLRDLGFAHDIESGVNCRFKTQGITVDIMPTNDPSIGFSNQWYAEGFKLSSEYVIDENCTVKILSPPYFIATKIEAFKSRGGNDGRTSKDFEDIVYVLENRESIWQEMDNAGEEVKAYLKSEFSILLINPNHHEWIECHVERALPPATNKIINELKKFTT